MCDKYFNKESTWQFCSGKKEVQIFEKLNQMYGKMYC
jgi:hypothetical protein